LGGLHYYLFYKFYRLFERFKTTRWLTDYKAILVLTYLEVIVFCSFYNNYHYYKGTLASYDYFSFGIGIPMLLIILAKWFFFVKDDSWRNYIKVFDNYRNEENEKGGYIVLGLVVAIMVNFSFSLYLIRLPKA